MNETKTETTFGSDIREALTEWNRTVEEADTAWHLVENERTAKWADTVQAMRESLGYDEISNNVVHLFKTVARMKDETYNTAKQKREETVKEAAAKRNAVLEGDPFMKFVATYITDEYGVSYAESFYEAAPFTFDSLKKLATDQSWCSDFEDAMKRAAEAGALPDDTVEVRRQVTYDYVPGEFNAEAGEEWVRVFRVPAYVRTEDSYGDKRSAYALRNYIIKGSDTYKKVSKD